MKPASAQRSGSALSDVGGGIVLGLWPAELKPQAAFLYQDGRGAAMAARARSLGWEVWAVPQLAFFTSSPSKRLYMHPEIDPSEYARRCEKQDAHWIGQHQSGEVRDSVWPWLKSRGYVADDDDGVLDEFLHILGRRAAHLRPALRLHRRWGRRGGSRPPTRFPSLGRAEIDEVLAAAGDARLPSGTSRSGAARASRSSRRSPRRRAAWRLRPVSHDARSSVEIGNLVPTLCRTADHDQVGPLKISVGVDSCRSAHVAGERRIATRACGSCANRGGPELVRSRSEASPAILVEAIPHLVHHRGHVIRGAALAAAALRFRRHGERSLLDRRLQDARLQDRRPRHQRQERGAHTWKTMNPRSRVTVCADVSTSIQVKHAASTRTRMLRTVDPIKSPRNPLFWTGAAGRRIQLFSCRVPT